MADEIIKLNSDEPAAGESSNPTEIPGSLSGDIQIEDPQNVDAMNSILRRKLVPVGVATVGGDAKLFRECILSGLLFVSATPISVSTDVNGITQTRLKKYTFPKNSFHVGMVVRITARGQFTSDSTRQWTLRIGVNDAPTDTINSISSPSEGASGQPWEIEWIGILTAIGSSATMVGQMRGTEGPNIRNSSPNTAYPFSTLVDVTLALTCQWSAPTAGNTLTINQFLVEVLN